MRALAVPKVSAGLATRAGLVVLALLVLLAGLGLAGCSSVANDVAAPLGVIKDTDVTVETTLQAVLQAAEVGLETRGSFAGFGPGSSSGTNVTPGASSGPGQVSYAVTPGGGGLVIAAWNKADRHCIGAVDVHGTIPVSVLGITSPGEYYFVAPAASSSACDAASLESEGSAPSGWPEAPSTAGWPQI